MSKLSNHQRRTVEKQILEIRRVIDLTNKRTGANRCGCSKEAKEELDNYLNTWVAIPLLKIEQVLGFKGDSRDGAFTKEELEQV